MKPKTFILMAVAGTCGLVAMLGVQQAMQGGQRTAAPQTERVLVAQQNVETGMRLTADNVDFREIAVGSLPADPIKTKEEYLERAARVPLLAGDIVRLSRLTEKGGYGKSMAIPAGMRGHTISVNDTLTASGMLQPGDRVDVLVTYRSVGERGQQMTKTKTLLEYVKVFATDNVTASELAEESKDKKHTSNVTLLLLPEQVPYVTLAEAKGELSLSWRQRLDDEILQTRDVDEQLMEELEGTIGVNEQFPFHDDRENAFSQEINGVIVTDEKPNASQFLDTVDPGSTQATSAPVSVTTPPPNLWEVKIHNGSEIVSQQFEIEEEDVLQNAGITDIIQSVWGKNSGLPDSLPNLLKVK